jgi:protein gp37
MAESSSIEWTRHTFNLWHGCVKVSPGCKHCYAEDFDRRKLNEPVTHWGPLAPRWFARDSYMAQPLAWNRKAERDGERTRVFCMSMGDLFERHALPIQGALQGMYRQRLYELIAATPWLDWLLLTKRPENIADMVPASWSERPPFNVWLGASIEDQATAAERLPILLDVPARVHFASYEPALGPLDLEAAAPGRAGDLDWLIAGSESGQKARSARRSWFRDARDQCQRLGIHFFYKQWVEHGTRNKVSLPMLDGRQWCEVPTPEPHDMEHER